MQLSWEEIEIKAVLQGRDKWSDLAKLAYARNLGDIKNYNVPSFEFQTYKQTGNWPKYESDIEVTNRFTKLLAEMVRRMRADNFRRLKTLDFTFSLRLGNTGDFDIASISHMYCDTAMYALTVDSYNNHFWLRINNDSKYKFHKNNKDKSKLPYDVNLKTHYNDCLELFRKYFVSKGIK